jgi:hypothetical protein
VPRRSWARNEEAILPSREMERSQFESDTSNLVDDELLKNLFNILYLKYKKNSSKLEKSR